MGTKYNVLYNGNIALERGKEGVNNEYTENFWELLPVERMKVTEDAFLPGQTKNADFERAEEKAIKAIQRHGMNINGKEKNPQIDEAYLLLGQARYFDKRFVPAMAAFNNILNKYPTSDKINQVKIWREKTSMRLDNDQGAIDKLKRLLEEEELEDQDLADAQATLAQAYINIKAKDSALVHLEVAAQNTKINREKARYRYIKGQLYNEFGHKDSANIEFDKIIDMHRKIPRSFYINAHLEKSNNFDTSNGDLVAFEEYLSDLEENRENRPFLDKIYYRIAEYHRGKGSDSLSEVYYNKSLRKTTKDKYLRSLSYETLGNMYFDRNIYKTAGAYYDSTMTAMVLNSKPYRIIKKKRENLDDVILYEGIAQVNDSILRMVSLPKEEQLAIYTKYAEDQRLKAEEERKRQEEASKKQSSQVTMSPGVDRKAEMMRSKSSAMILPGSSRNLQTPGQSPKGGSSSFYFYNPTTVAYGKNEFLKLWGERKLQDNWRLNNQRGSSENIAIGGELIAESELDERFNPDLYLASLPTEQTEIDSIAKERNFAYYQLGIIYKEKFKELELAQTRFEKLLQNNPEDRLILPSKYNLYHIYKELGLNNKAEEMKTVIINDYPDSRYAEILLNPQSELAKDENSPEAIYTKLYKQFTNEEYAKVIAEADVQINRLEGDIYVPKFEILKASAKGRLYGFNAYKESISYIALNYGNSEEGKKAQEIMDTALPVLAKKDFVSDEDASNFNVIFQFDNNSEEDIDAFIKILDEEVAKVKYFDLSTSKDVYDENTTFVVVHGLKSIQGANGFVELLKSEEKDKRGRPVKPKITKDYFAISSPNYAIVQRHKNLNTYLELQ
ncbi:protein involved in gliding motility SprE [Winogradskyella epiphytica]|uniref:Protein involved in gliding motility SprE n=1 Tax=Winogradskyella epiphytica TaxID=262005 RepID=A0A2V4YH80_9FLAO|nr:tetratricopeptide repeat protein [Winogradskyella epiphytica]PYE83273.1 protein involved in gliding motility SprE [Winogradskyella epiphytica]GGW56991.1 gliding motility protein [Winogradskyella epiphytica]